MTFSEKSDNMKEQYMIVRGELGKSIDKQESLNDITFTLLGVSCAFSSFLANEIFILAILLMSNILLSRIIHYRDVTYYLSSYLRVIEAENENVGFSWENQIETYRTKHFSFKRRGRKNPVVYKCCLFFAKVIKNLGYFVLSTCLLWILLVALQKSDKEVYSAAWIMILQIVAACGYIVNLFLTAVICTDRKNKQYYEDLWKEMLRDERKVMEREG